MPVFTLLAARPTASTPDVTVFLPAFFIAFITLLITLPEDESTKVRNKVEASKKADLFNSFTGMSGDKLPQYRLAITPTLKVKNALVDPSSNESVRICAA